MLGWLVLAVLSCSGAPDSGVVVRELEPSGAAARAGLLRGDVVVAWSQPSKTGMGGEIRSPFELRSVEVAHSPLAPVALEVRRGRRRLRPVLDGGEWEVVTWPVLTPGEAARARETVQAGWRQEPLEAAEIWTDLERRALDQGRRLDAAWFAFQSAVALVEADEGAGASAAFERSRSFVDPSLAAALLDAEGEAWAKAGLHEKSLAAHRGSLDLAREQSAASPGVAWSLYQVAKASYNNRDITGRELASDSADLYRALPSAHLRLARALNLEANFSYVTGALDEADALYREALVSAERVATDGRTVADLCLNLGAVAHDRGRLREAEDFYRRTLAIEEALDPTGVDAAWVMNNLGILAKDTGDLEGARTYYGKALEIFSRERSGGVEEAGLLNNLGNVAQRQGDLHAAESYQRRALAIREALESAATDVASSLHNLGSILGQQDRYDEATVLLERALAIKEDHIPGTLLYANTLQELGMMAAASGRLAEAESLYGRALAIRRRVTDGGSQVAVSLFGLGEVAYRAGRLAEAENRWREALETIEAQRARWEAPSEQSYRFVAPYQRFYRRLAGLLVETGREREAFELLEGARARALRVMMAQSGRRAGESIPAELAAERNRLAAELDRASSRLERVNPELEPAAAELLSAEIRDLRIGQDDLEARIRAVVPELGRFDEPDPPALEELRRALDPGTLLLSYSVGAEATLLFAVSAVEDGGAPVVALELPIGEVELRRRIDIFRALIERGRNVPILEPGLVSQGSRLFDLLLRPAFELVESADRLLLVLEGPLLTLPFGAVVTKAEPLEFLAQSRPSFMAPSAAVFATLRESRRPALQEPRFVAFGDPETSEAGADARVSPWLALPYARREVGKLADLFEGRARALIGPQATEAAVMDGSGEADYLHFATHAFADRRFPLDSGLVLASVAADGETGILRASEILAGLRIDAELVTLSACDTALGGELAGEGMIGLARAFQYAGARSLLVSQWQVSDRSTAELMVRFYRHLEAGRSKIEALHAARADLIAAPIEGDGGQPIDARHPFHWAAFQLIGDWR